MNVWLRGGWVAVAVLTGSSCVAPRGGGRPTAAGVDTGSGAVAILSTGPHAVIGVWLNRIEGRHGYARRFRPGGTMTAWQPDGTAAGEGRFWVLDAETVVVEFPNGDTELAHLVEPDVLRLEHVMPMTGQHRRYHAFRAEAADAPP